MSRKLLAAAIVWIVGCLLWYFKEGTTFNDWANFTWPILMIYTSGNVGEWVAKKFGKTK